MLKNAYGLGYWDYNILVNFFNKHLKKSYKKLVKMSLNA